MVIRRVLTGIKPTGQPHIGNFMGAIKPALELAKHPENRCYYFVADAHALTVAQDPGTFYRTQLDVAATWLAFGLDAKTVTFYRQSDVPEIFELTWILSCSTAKGLMNRAHAYKAAVSENELAGCAEVDAGINMGLYSYPILMAADILMFQTDLVPVGKDQLQHVEIARDIAVRFNHVYGETFTLPQALIQEATAVLPGLDGRKMSKSYGNTIPLFAPSAELRKLIFRARTDSTPPGAPKDPDASPLFQMYQAFAHPGQTLGMRKRFAEGIAWAQVKAELYEVMEAALTGPRAMYNELMGDETTLEQVLRDGAEKARAEATALMRQVRSRLGVPSRRPVGTAFSR